MATTVPPVADPVFEDRVIRKAFRHLISFLFILFIFSYLDRINIGFAALAMNKELKLSSTMYGLAITIFYVGYAFFEIPSNICLRRYGARKWIARILITWGLASAATMFAVGPKSLYAVRLMVGIFEAGFLPGIILYLTYWFPPTYRARATSLFMIAQPVTMIFGAPLSGLILDHTHGAMGFAGWRWLFVIEGLPAVLLGVVTYFYLSDGPADAKWLTDQEKVALQNRLEREQPASTTRPGWGAWRELITRPIVFLSIAYFCLVEGLNGNAQWAPQIVREVFKSYGFTFSTIGLLIAIPSCIALVVMVIWGAHSDRKMERTWHVVLPVLLAACGWLLIAWASLPPVRLLGVAFCATGAFTGMSLFWTIPARVLSPNGRPIGIAFINMWGMVSAAVSPLIFGFLRDKTNTWAASMIFVACMLIVCSGFVLAVRAKETVAAADATLAAAQAK